MTLYPEAQKKAQQEIDLVVGNDRLPVANDYEQLPYVRALMSEVYRFSPVAPVGALGGPKTIQFVPYASSWHPQGSRTLRRRMTSTMDISFRRDRRS